MTSISTPEEVKAAEKQPGAVFLDVRGADEVKAECLQARPFKHATCTLDDCSELMNKAETLLSDKHAPVIVFCRSGRRAGKAKEVLEQMGYTKVLNAGGLNDLRYL
ncbi:hypothetical protein ACHAXM_012155 [Skeletonema potamos]